MAKDELEKIRESRLEELIAEADFYLWNFHDKGKLSPEQIEAAKEVRNAIGWFGESAELWYDALGQIIKLSTPRRYYGKRRKKRI